MSENKTETVAAAAESNDNPKAGVDFIRARIMDDNASGRFGGQVHTRFPPEPVGVAVRSSGCSSRFLPNNFFRLMAISLSG